IIQRALQKSVTAWAMTRADPELQQVQFDEIVATEDAHLTVRATIQPAGNAFPLAFRD
ncbi:unnamed protein product, partial [Durusdinium trenchii]